MRVVERDFPVIETLQVAAVASQTDGDFTDAAVTQKSQVAVAATQTDEDFTARERLHHVSIGEMIYQFLAHTVDTRRSNLTDKLAAKDILSPAEHQEINAQKNADVKVKSLVNMLREKSADEFESFLTTLSETGQQSVADVVRQALYTVGQTGQNPLQYVCGKSDY